ncbi:hypothetical protein EV578_10180 [Streptomyces sp. BK205]|nr:hypothetical protein EV578_10180 [Streptomyces sp. BK205]
MGAWAWSADRPQPRAGPRKPVTGWGPGVLADLCERRAEPITEILAPRAGSGRDGRWLWTAPWLTCATPPPRRLLRSAWWQRYAGAVPLGTREERRGPRVWSYALTPSTRRDSNTFCARRSCTRSIGAMFEMDSACRGAAARRSARRRRRRPSVRRSRHLDQQSTADAVGVLAWLGVRREVRGQLTAEPGRPRASGRQRPDSAGSGRPCTATCPVALPFRPRRPPAGRWCAYRGSSAAPRSSSAQ